MKYFVVLYLLHCGFEMGHAQSLRTSWPMINGDAARSSFANLHLELPLQIADTLFVNYRRESGMALWENKLYLADYASDSNRLVVTDVITGDSLWSFYVPNTGGGMEFVPAVSEGVVMVGGQGGQGLHGLDAGTGDSLWFLPVGSLYTRCPVISDSMVYLCAHDSLVCFNLHSGKVYWSKASNTFQMAPVVDEQKVYSCGYNLFDYIFALDKFTGDTVWINNSINVGSFISLGVDSQYLYTGYVTTISALNKATGDVAWTVELDTSQMLTDFPGAFAWTKDYLVAKYFENGQNQFLVLNKKTGQELNRFASAFMSYSAPTVINDYLADYYGGNFFLFDLLSGNVAFSMSDIPVAGNPSQIIAADDKIFIAGMGDYVIVLEGNTTAVLEPEYAPVSFSVYPNPAQDQLNLLVNLDVGSHLIIELFTQAGWPVGSRNLGVFPRGQHRLSLPFGDLRPGLYYLYLQTLQGDVVRNVIIIE